jgi:hypothetical protein
MQKLSRKIKTMDDLLTRDDINATLQEVLKCKKDITDIIIIYKDSDGVINQSAAVSEAGEWSKDCDLKVLGMLEYVKNMILNPIDDCEDE